MTELNEKIGSIKKEYVKDDDLLVAHMLTNLPKEYNEFRLQMSVKKSLSLNELKKHMRFYWFNKLGGREILHDKIMVRRKVIQN